MKIADYPRPHNDSGIGFRYFPDADHTGRADLERWVPRLQSLGASWLVLQTPPTRPLPDFFLQQVMLADIETVIMLTPERVGPLELGALRGTAGALADSGVHYVALFDRPNCRESWLPQEWAKPDLVERFVDYLAPALEVVAAEGLTPVLPPLEPFGAYWDTVFLHALLSSLRRRGLGALLARAAVGMRNFANGRPLDWGAGGRDAWPQARPYTNPQNGEGQDHRGFRLFEWYQAIIEQELGHPLPLICCANGPQSSPTAREAGSQEASLHAGRAAEMARMMMAGELPSTVLNHAFWLLAAERDHVCYQDSWFDADGVARLPAVEALEKLVKQARPVGKSQTRPERSPRIANHSAQIPNNKPIDHYLLLPVFEWGTSRWHLSIVQEYIETFLPTCGFSAEEAILARRVTIVGNEQGVGAETAARLAAAGCQVERIAGRNGHETLQLLQKLARNKQHKQREAEKQVR